MGLSLGHLLIVLLLVFVMFGAGKLPRVMGDLGKGIRNLRDGMSGDGEDEKIITPEQEVLPPVKKKKTTVKK